MSRISDANPRAIPHTFSAAFTMSAMVESVSQPLHDTIPTHRRSSRRAVSVLVYLALAVGTVLTFSRVRENGFVRFDDDIYLTSNPHVQQGLTWQTLAWASRTTAAANWHPLTWVSHLIDVSLFGMNPAAHHWMNVALHTLAALLLLGALRAMTGSLWRSAFVAAVFALHPLRVESVAWASERKDVLGAVFWILTMLAYARYARKPGAGRYLVVVVCVALGLLAKPMLVTIPFALLLLDLWPLRRVAILRDLRDDLSTADIAAPHEPSLASSRQQWRRVILEKVPLLILVLASSIVTIWAQHRGGAVMSTERVPIDLRVENAVVAYVRYLGMLFWPSKLAVFYPLPREIETWQVLASAALLVGVSTLAIRWSTCRPWFLVGWLWHLGTLVPVIGLIQVGEQALADRYTYIPLIGVTIMIAWGVEKLTRPLGAIRKPLLAVASLAICAAMAWRTWVQIGYWRDTFTLFDHALAVTADNYRAEDCLGTELSRAGRRDDAISHFRRAIAIKPDYAEAHFNLGNALRDSGDIRGAIGEYQQAVALRPKFAQAWNNLGALWAGLSDWNRAAAAFGQAAESLPDWPDAHANLARALEALGQPDAAAEEYQRALAIDPHSESARHGLERLRNASSQPARDR